MAGGILDKLIGSHAGNVKNTMCRIERRNAG